MSDSPPSAASHSDAQNAAQPANTIQIIQADQVTAQAWRNGGGHTRELLVWPTPGSVGGEAFCVGKGGARAAGGGHGAERFAAHTPGANPDATNTTNKNANADWQLRISRADITADGPFSAFPGVQRWFVVLSGKGVVLHLPTSNGHTLHHQLLPGHTPLHFDGGLAPGCSLVDGPTQDLNLMARGGQACMQTVDADQPWAAAYALCGIYTACSGLWSDGLQTIALPAHSLLWIEQPHAVAMRAGTNTNTNASAGANVVGDTDTTTIPVTHFRFAAQDSEPTRAWWLGYTPDRTL